MRSVLQIPVAAALVLTAAGCSSSSAPPDEPSQVQQLGGDCVDVDRGGVHLALKVVDGLHAIDPGTAALNTDFTAGDDITVELEAWVLRGAQTRRDATGALFLYAAQKTPKLPADVALQRTILESSGSEPGLQALHLGRATVAGRSAESASVSTPRGDYGAWTFTAGTTRFILDSRQQPGSGGFDLAQRAPSLLAAGRCADS